MEAVRNTGGRETRGVPRVLLLTVLVLVVGLLASATAPAAEPSAGQAKKRSAPSASPAPASAEDEASEDAALDALLEGVADDEPAVPSEEVTEEPAAASGGIGEAEPAEEPEPPAPPPAKVKATKKSAPKAAAPKPPPAAARPRRSAASGSGAPNDQEILQQLGLTQEARREEAKGLVEEANRLMQNMDLVKAEGRLEEATRLDPQNADAERLLSQVRMLLGSTSGEVPEIWANVRDQVRVQREEAVAVIRRLIIQAGMYREQGEYVKAIDNLERAIEGIRNFPFNLDLDEDLRQAQSLLATVEEEKKNYEEEERQRFLKMVAETRAAEVALDLRYVENQIRELRRKAEAAESEKKYDRAITLYERILTIQPRNNEIQTKLVQVKAQRHTYKMGEYFQKAIDNYELAVLGIEESSVTYQQIFRYPDTRQWQRISPKVITIEEEIAATESPVEKEIRRKLEDPYEIGFEEGVEFKDALSALQTLTGVNFILNKDGQGAAATPVKLPRFPDLPLKNILSLILEAAGEDYSYAIKEGAVVIGPKSSLKTKEYLRFYEINDLIQTRPDYPAPKVALDELQGKSTTGAPLESIDAGTQTKAGGPIERDLLLELIKKELGEGDTPAEGISIMSGKLAARTTLENHLKLAKLLDQFRASTGVMVTVESRFLDIQDNFLEAIGVNFGSANSTFLPNEIPDIDGAGTSVAPGYEFVDPSGSPDVRIASIGSLSQPLGTKVNPFNISGEGGGAFQLNVLDAERYQIEALLVAVHKEQELRRLNAPRVTAFNGQVAHTLVVNQAAYIQDLEVNQTGVIPVINPVIDVLNSGSILEVRPTVSYDRKYVVLEIQPTLAEQLDSDVAILNLSGNFTVVPVELPVLSVTKIKTTVTVPDGGTVLVGGLKREIYKKAQIGIPGFLDIPLINLISGRKGMSQLRSNLFVLINSKVTVVREEEQRLFGT